MPDSVVRLQRREYYRVVTPLVRPLVCDTPDPADARRTLPLRVLDLSAGGMALLVPQEKAPFAIGDTLEGCSLELPEAGRVIFNASVRSLALHARPSGTRIGCSFLRLPGHAHKMIQRLILGLERERQARN
jgi:c-di-GMP-binding flagellar brake protein YcgR